MDNTVVRFVAEDNNQIKSIIKIVIIFAGLLSLFFSISIFMLAEKLSYSLFQKTELAPVLKSIAFGITGLSLLILAGSALQGLKKIRSSIIFVSIILNCSLIIFIFLGDIYAAEEMAGLYALFSVLIAILSFIYIIFNLPDTTQTKIDFKAFFSSCLPLWLVVISQQIFNWSGTLGAGFYLESDSVARLAAAQRTSMIVSFLLVVVNLIVAPRFADFYKKGHMEELRNLASSAIKLTTFAAMPLVVVMIFFSNEIMSLFGEEFSKSGVLLSLLSIGQFINVMSGHEKDVRNISIIFASLTIFLVVILTPLYGEIGNAMAIMLSIAFQNILLVYFVRLRLGFNIFALWRSNSVY